MIHTKEEINSFLSRSFFAVLSFVDRDMIVSHLMIFGHTIDGVFYLFSQNDKALFSSLIDELSVSVLIYKEEEELSDIRQLSISGKACIVDGFDGEDASLASMALGEKSPFIQNAFAERDESVTVIKLEAEKISSISFGELREHLSPVVLQKD